MDFLDFMGLSSFRRSWESMGLGDKELSELQEQIMSNPEAGSQIGYLRKIRFAIRGQGKSGETRVILVYVCMKNLVFLLYSHPKIKKEIFTDAEKKGPERSFRHVDERSHVRNFMLERKPHNDK